MTTPSEEKPVKVYKANTQLQKKAGTGKFAPHRIQSAESLMEEPNKDFFKLAKDNLDRLEKAIENSHKGISKENLLKEISAPLFELKSSAPMYKFDLVGVLAGIMFEFIQKTNELDEKAIEIITAHHKTLYAIISNNMVGDGGSYGKQLRSELADVCKKYFNQKNR